LNLQISQEENDNQCCTLASCKADPGLGEKQVCGERNRDKIGDDAERAKQNADDLDIPQGNAFVTTVVCWVKSLPAGPDRAALGECEDHEGDREQHHEEYGGPYTPFQASGEHPVDEAAIEEED
jgi:hypothetical protein